MGRALLAALLLLVLAPSTAGARAPLRTIVQDDAQLLHRSDADTRASLQQLHDLGVSTVRVTAGWSVLTRTPDAVLPPLFDQSDPAAYEQGRFAGLDRLVRLAPAYGLEVMVDVAFWAPHWATAGDGVGPRARTNVDPAAYARFATALAKRYDGAFVPPADGSRDGGVRGDEAFLDALFGGRGDLALPVLGAPAAPSTLAPLPKVTVFTLWNEPNHPAFLQPQWVGSGSARRPASPGVYRAMVHAAYPAMKAVRPDSTILVGGTAAQSAGRGGVAPLRFLRRLACVDDALRPVTDHDCAGFTPVLGDGWAHHPYSLRTRPDAHAADPDQVPIGDLDRLTDLLDTLAAMGRIAPGLRHLWLTEYGYETNPPNPSVKYSTGDQARFLTWAEELASANPHVVSFAQFLLRDLPPATTPQTLSARRSLGQWESGLAFADGRPKLATSSFAAGIHLEAAGDGLRAWGRLRTLAPGVRVRAALEQRVPGGHWRAVASRGTRSPRAARSFRAASVLTRTLAATPHARYRLRWRDAAGTLHATPSVTADP